MIFYWGLFGFVFFGVASTSLAAHETNLKIIFQAASSLSLLSAMTPGIVRFRLATGWLVWLVFIFLISTAVRAGALNAWYPLILLGLAIVIYRCEFHKQLCFPNADSLRYVWWGVATACAGIIGGAVIGVLPTTETIVITAGIYKTSLGFWNPNTAASFLFGLVLCAVVLRDSAKLKISLIAFAATAPFLVSRTFIAAVVLVGLCSVVAKRASGLWLRMAVSCAVGFVVAFWLFVMAMKLWPNSFDGPLIAELNAALSYRITYIKDYLAATSNLELIFGQWMGGGEVDAGWVNLLIQFGLVASLIGAVAYWIGVINARGYELRVLFLITMVFGVVSFSEDLVVVYNPAAIVTFLALVHVLGKYRMGITRVRRKPRMQMAEATSSRRRNP